MELSERKKQILKAIIGDYIRTAEPVGSKSIASRPGFSFSSATIRNEMSELEELGYLEKPHTSAGRIPSASGYRLYVDELMDSPDAQEEESEDLGPLMQLKVKEFDRLIREAGRLVAELTEYASVAVTPNLQQVSLKQFELIPIEPQRFVLVIVTNTGAVKSKIVHTTAPVSRDESELLTYVLNQTLTGIPLTGITAERFDIVRRAAGLTALLAPVAEYIAELIEELGDQQLFFEGASKLLNYPEYQDTHKTQALFDYIGKDAKSLFPIHREEIDGVQIMIGPESGQSPLSESSMIYAKYNIGEVGQGVIGIVGPTRMDYARLSAKLSHFAKGLNKLIAESLLEEF